MVPAFGRPPMRQLRLPRLPGFDAGLLFFAHLFAARLLLRHLLFVHLVVPRLRSLPVARDRRALLRTRECGARRRTCRGNHVGGRRGMSRSSRHSA